MGALHPLVGALVATGEVDAARAVVAEHREFFATHPGIGVAESLLLAAAQTGESSPAAAYAATAAVGVWWVAAEAADLLARRLLVAGDAAGAVAATTEALETAGAIGLRGLACRLRLTQAAAARALGEGDPAEAAHAALAEAAELGCGPSWWTGSTCWRRSRRTASARVAWRGRPPRCGPSWTPSRPDWWSWSRPTRRARGWGGSARWYAARSRGRRARPRSGWESLTPTEGEVVALAARGLSNAAIGAQLLVSPGTVRTHLRSVFGKLGVTSRAELAAQAARRGL